MTDSVRKVMLISSEEDLASRNIRSHLLDMEYWDMNGEMFGNPVWVNDNHLSVRYTMVVINDLHVRHENLDKELRDAGFSFKSIIVLSRHRAASGIATLTVHPIGNWHEAKAGGRDNTLVPAAPHLMSEALRLININGAHLKDTFRISMEATHHGPYMETPTFFIEIGSDETMWPHEEAGRVLAKTVLDLRDRINVHYPVAIGVGGGHYAPRMSDIILGRKVSVGHVIPTYALDGIKEEMFQKAIDASGAEMVYFHKKAIKKDRYRELVDKFESLGMRVVRSKDLEPLVDMEDNNRD